MSVKTKPKKTQCYRRNKKNKTLKRIRLEWCELDFTSKMVIVIGTVLLIELVASIFFYPNKDDVSTGIVFRTALSSVIGYILGGMNTPATDNATQPNQAPSINNEKDSIPNPPLNHPDTGDCEPDKLSLQNATYLRVMVVTIICLICIVTLVVASIFNLLDYKEGVIQIRNLISTTIGFLISKSNHKV